MLDTERIINLIMEKGYTCASIEKAIGFGNGSIRRWETSSPSVNKLFELAKFLNVPIDFLLTGRKSDLSPEQQELLSLWDKLDPIKQAEFKGELKGYIKAKDEFGGEKNV